MNPSQANDGIYEADTGSKRRSPPSYGSTDRGHDTAIAFGRVDTLDGSDYEDTPLLSRGQARETRISSEQRSGDNRGPPLSSSSSPSGKHDFDGLPRWKRPSVS
jgi:hypothetical protein